MTTPSCEQPAPAWFRETTDPSLRRHLCWVFLRQIVESSREDVLDELWPNGWWHPRSQLDSARIEELALGIATGGTAASTPERLLAITRMHHDLDPRPFAEQAQRQGWRLLTPDDPEWPELLCVPFITLQAKGLVRDDAANPRGVRAMPFALWVAGPGNLAELSLRSCTIVGTRAATGYGREVTERLASFLSSHAVTVISGGALGIDAVAHSRSVAAAGRTVAVLACGIDVTYPAAHRGLFEEIKQNGGLVVSEYPIGLRPARHRFLTRNRLVAALGNASLVVEAAHRSGALNTMNWAESMGKSTLAIPGPITSVSSLGCLERIRCGRATLIWRPEQVLEHVVSLSAAVESQLELDVEGAGGELLSLTQTMVYDAVPMSHHQPSTLAQIASDAGLSERVARSALAALCRTELIVEVGGGWVRI